MYDLWGESMTIQVLVCYADGRQVLEQREVPEPEAEETVDNTLPNLQK